MRRWRWFFRTSVVVLLVIALYIAYLVFRYFRPSPSASSVSISSPNNTSTAPPKKKPSSTKTNQKKTEDLVKRHKIYIEGNNSSYEGTFTMDLSPQDTQSYKYKLVETDTETRLDTGNFKKDFEDLMTRYERARIKRVVVEMIPQSEFILVNFLLSLENYLKKQGFQKVGDQEKNRRIMSKTFVWEKER